MREQTDQELVQQHGDTLKALTELRLKKRVGGGGEQPLRLRVLRREVARIKTVMRERGL